jgi:hypothetical protein
MAKKFLEIPLHLYRLIVIVTWETSFADLKRFIKRNTHVLTADWQKDYEKHRNDAVGVCMTLGDNNSDVVIWLKEKPTRASQYGVLYHELFHAVDHITRTHNLDGEIEARAYIFEHLVNQCNSHLWPRSKKKIHARQPKKKKYASTKTNKR